jgi:CheY-like chemotaxis protein
MPKALIVEDEPEANELLAMLVQLRGYETEAAFTGGEALMKAECGRPDLVFLDLMLPDLNGYDVCRALRASRQTNPIPVVMVTARLADDNRLQGFRVGAIDYIPKPYTPDQIFEAMADASAWSRSLDQAGDEATIELTACGDLASIRDIHRLVSLVLKRTDLAEPAVRSMGEALVELAVRAAEWGRQVGKPIVANLHYRIEPGRIVLTLRDRSGWFAEHSPRDPDRLGGIIARTGFDEVAFPPDFDQVVLTRRS